MTGVEQPVFVRISWRIYRALMLAYPRDFRRRNGEEMVRLFRQRCGEVLRRSGPAALVALWPGALRDLIVNAFAERFGGRASRYVTRSVEDRGSSSASGREGGRRGVSGERQRGDRSRPALSGSGRGSGAGDRGSGPGRFLESLARDLRYAARMLAGQPGFSAVVVVTLALAIGVNTTIFSIADAVVFPDLPFTEPGRLVFVNASNTELGRLRAPISLPDFRDLQRSDPETVEGLAAWAGDSRVLGGSDGPVRIQGMRTTPSFFEVTGLQPVEGRSFRPEDATPGAVSVALVSHGAWEQYLGADPDLVGRTISLDGVQTTVVGILPERLANSALGSAAIWTPLVVGDTSVPRDRRDLAVIGRLAPGATVDQVEVELRAISRDLEERHPETNAGWRMQAWSLRQALAGANANSVLALMTVAVGFVLLIACANVANLMLARGAARRREIAVRLAMGADRGRLVRQLLTEGALLAIVGGALGLLVMDWCIRALVWVTRSRVALFTGLEIDPGVALFALALAMSTPLIFGLVPALRASRSRVHADLEGDGRGGTQGRRGRWSRAALVVTQVSLAVVLLVVSGLAVRSTIALTMIEPGFEPDGVLTARIDLSTSEYGAAAAQRTFFQQVRERVAVVAGVEAVALTSHRPIVGGAPTRSAAIEGRPASSPSDVPLFATVTVTPGFLDTLEIPLLRGRWLSSRDDEASRPVALVSRAAAERHWPDADPLGVRLKLGGSDAPGPWIEVVGVVDDVRNPDADQPPEPHLYLPLAQNPIPGAALVLRTAGDPLALVGPVRQAVVELDPNQPIHDVRTMRQILYDDLSSDYAVIGLITFFALVALTLAAAGVYSVIAHSVSRRTREIGVRIALGAGRGAILSMITRQGMVPVIVGLAVGLTAGLGIARLMAGLLYGVGPTDPVTFLGIPLLLATIGLVASLVPARRATGVDPMAALRAE